MSTETTVPLNSPSTRARRARRTRLGVGARAIGLLTCAALTLSALSFSGQSSAAAPGGAADARAEAGTKSAAIPWTACRNGFECARVAVPLDYDKPRGAAISLSLIRLPASTPSRRIGSLFLNPGGPGGSGVDFARSIAKFLPLEIRARFDVVGFDPRGIAGSTPLRCYDTLEQAVTDLPPFPFPQTPAEEQKQRVADQKLTSACATHGGAILRHMSTADVARDLNRLRQLVGDKKLNYLGYSYGSVLGQTYANLFPRKVRAVVIDGVVDPIAWSTGRGIQATRLPFSTRLRSDVGAQSTLKEFFRLCDAAGPDCAFSGHSAKRYAAIAERLKRGPVQIIDPETGETFELTYNDLIAFSLAILYQAAAWPDAATLLADVDAQVSAAELGRDVAALRRALGLNAKAQEEYPNVVEGSPGVACSDSLNPSRFTAWQEAADVSEQRHGYFGRIWTWTWSSCISWPTTALDDRYLGPWTARTSKPVLVVGNYFDPATRYHGAVVASRLLPNSRLLSYAGWGHAAFFIVGNYCVDSKVTRYLLTTRTPKAGTTCKPEGSPFGPLTSAAASPASMAKKKAQAAATATLLPPNLRRVLQPK